MVELKKRVVNRNIVEHSIHHSLRPVYNDYKSKELILKNNRFVVEDDLNVKSKSSPFFGFVILGLSVLTLFFSISMAYSGITGFISNDSSGSINSLVGVLLFVASLLGFYLYLMRER